MALITQVSEKQIVEVIQHYLYDDYPTSTIRSIIMDKYGVTDTQYRKLFSIAFSSL
jgi:hypothetical protein